jgi:S-adenosylmethionine decarboxylase
VEPVEPCRVSGFNNLSKCLRLGLYRFGFASQAGDRAGWVEREHASFAGGRLAETLRRVAKSIDARVLSLTATDYEPLGASALTLVANPGGVLIAAHLDKSHASAHTYLDWGTDVSACSIRIDLEISTCGKLVPLEALDGIFVDIQPDLAVVDYSVRGFTRDEKAERMGLDIDPESIASWLAPERCEAFEIHEQVILALRFWHARCVRRRLDDRTIWGGPPGLDEVDRVRAREVVERDVRQLFEGLPE